MPKPRLIKAYSRILAKYYYLFWTVLLLALALAAPGLRRLRLRVDTGRFFLQQDQNARQVKQFRQTYQIGQDVGIYVVYRGQDGGSLLRGQVLQQLALLSRELELLPFVRSVQSVADFWPRSSGGSQQQRLQNFARAVARFPHSDSLYSADWRSAWLLVELYPYASYLDSLPAGQGEGPLIDPAALAALETDFAVGPLLAGGSVVLPAELSSVAQLRSAMGSRGGKLPSQIFSQVLLDLLQGYEHRFATLFPTALLQLIPVGTPVNSLRLERELTADLRRVLGVAALICLLCILLLMRSPLAAFGALLCVASNILLVFGLSAWLGLVVDKTFVVIPVLLGLASSISYCVHIEKDWDKDWGKSTAPIAPIAPNGALPGSLLSALLSARAGTQRRIWARHRLQQALEQNCRPLSFAALTTVLSLLSFVTVPIAIIQSAGLQSAIAVSLSYILSLTLFASIMLFQGRGPSRGPKGKAKNLGLSKLQGAVYAPAIRLAACCYRHGRTTVLLGLLLVAFSLSLLPGLRVDLSTQSVLGTQFQYVRELLEVSGSKIGAGGFYNIDLQFAASDPLQKKYLLQVETFQTELQKLPLVKHVRSLTSFIRLMQTIYKNSPELPENPQQLQQALLTWEHVFGGHRSQWYAESRRSLRILVQVEQSSSAQNLAHAEQVVQLAKKVFGNISAGEAQIRAVPLGGVLQLAIMNQYITKGLLRSFLLSLLFVVLLLFFLLQNWRIGLIAAVPNLCSVLLTGAAVVLLQRSLEFVSMTIAPMVIGLAVDDTIYFLGHIDKQMAKKIPGCTIKGGKHRRFAFEDIGSIISSSLHNIAPALITTTLILAGLFASLLLSGADNIRYMGIYSLIAMLSALLFNLLLAPTLIRWAFGRRRE